MPWPITQEAPANHNRIVERAEETNVKMSIQGESQSHTRCGSPREPLFLPWSETSVHYLERALSVWVRLYDLLNGSGIVFYLELIILYYQRKTFLSTQSKFYEIWISFISVGKSMCHSSPVPALVTVPCNSFE